MHDWRAAGVFLAFMVLMPACGSDDENVDADGDGYTIAEGDCDDSDPKTYPGAPEDSQTDGKDQNCDGPGE